MMLRVGIIGCGNIADSHVEAVRRVGLGEVVAVCDRELLMAEQLADRYRIARSFDDMEAMLRETSPDVVHITTPPQSHRELAFQAIGAGCHVYVEKPLAVDHVETASVVEHARARGRLLTVGHIYQFDPPAVAMRSLIQRGVIGEPVHVESTYGYDLEGSFGQATMGSPRHWVHELPGKLIHNNLSHAVCKVTEFIDDERPVVRALAKRRRRREYGDVRDDVMDELRVVVMGERTSAYITFSSHARPISHHLRVEGTRNTVDVNYVTRTVTLERAPRLPSSIGRLLPAFAQGWEYHREGAKNVYRFARSEFHYFAGMNELVDRFHRSIVAGGDPPIPYDEVLRTSAMLDEIFRQI